MRKYYYFLFLIAFITCKKDESQSKTKLKACFSIVNAKISIGDTTLFNNCSENSVNFHWDFGDGRNSTDKEPTHIYNKIGEYKIELIASNDNLVDTFFTKISVLPLPDKIIYKELKPTTQLNTVTSMTSINWGICTEERPTPLDSTTFGDLDIDADSKNDFRFVVRHLNWASITNEYCGHCNRYLYDIRISGLTPEDSISYNRHNSGPKCYDTTEYISATDAFRNSDILYVQGGCAISRFNFQDTYIGIKHQNKLGWIHIIPFGINGIEINEFALNNTENNAIKAGQKQ